MGKKRAMLLEDVDLTAVKYEHEVIKAPHLTGFKLKLFVWLSEAPLVGSLIMSMLKKQNGMDEVVEKMISATEEINKRKPPIPFLISFNAEELRTQAAASTQRFVEGKTLSILDGIFMAIKDDIDCYPFQTKGGTSWYHEVRPVKEDAVCVSKLRSCGVTFIGKANMHELGLGTTGNNSNYG
ncbi:hypothetical protein NE237_001279 [Protea cynaroides]|uniref:Amidase domain-containing protein n=1 Tax=Protea cynaroides TaxID=273540 RepID=A0A9Q0KSS9_9MAGN|nr:hypothetical protein NE237_001279 [Protea cynaroides]